MRLWRVADVPAMADCITRSLDWLRPRMPWIEQEPLTPAEREQPGASVARPVRGTALHPRIGSGGLEIGYWVAPRLARRRVAMTTAGLLTEAALDADGIDRVEIHHDPANTRSALGYRQQPSQGEAVWRLTSVQLTPDLRAQLGQVAVRT